MKTAHIYSPGYALLAGLLLTASTGARAVDNNLHFYGNLLSKSCTLVVDGANLAEIHFPTVSNRDLMVAGQSAHLPVVFKLQRAGGIQRQSHPHRNGRQRSAGFSGSR